MKILLLGDSFSAAVKDNNILGWPILLEKDFTVDNKSQSGSSEFRILENLKKSNLDVYDKIIISHTSPMRTYVNYNPLHQDTEYHTNCDIIFSDIENRKDDFSVACQLFFKHIFDIGYAVDIHNLICQEIDKLTSNHDVLHITHFDYTKLYNFKDMINFYHHWLEHQGSVNHYNQQGNNFVYSEILKRVS
jgi:hypothetical protein